MLFDLKRSGSVREKGTGFKYYRVRPLFRMEEILCGRGGEECARLQWMDMRRQGEVEDLAVEWGISWEEAAAWLGDLALSGEWKVELRQAALHLYSEGFDAEEAAEEFEQYFSRSRLNGLERWKTCVSTLTSSACLNRSLDAYFGFRDLSGPCGHCPACCGMLPAAMEEEELPRYRKSCAPPSWSWRGRGSPRWPALPSWRAFCWDWLLPRPCAPGCGAILSMGRWRTGNGRMCGLRRMPCRVVRGRFFRLGRLHRRQ